MQDVHSHDIALFNTLGLTGRKTCLILRPDEMYLNFLFIIFLGGAEAVGVAEDQRMSKYACHRM